MKHRCEAGPSRVCDWCRIYSRCKLAPNLPPASPDKASCSNVLKASSTDTFFAPNNFNDKCGRLRARLLKVLWMARVLTWGSMLTRSWGMRCFALVESYSQHLKIFIAVNCEIVLQTRPNMLMTWFFLVATDLTTTAKIHFKLAPTNVTFSASKTWPGWANTRESVLTNIFDLHQFGVFPLVRVTGSTCMTSL